MTQIFFKSEDGSVYSYDIDEQNDLIEEAKNNKWVQIDQPEPVEADPNFEHLVYLSSTDWYVIRKIETGKDIPKDIIKLRQEARDSIK